MDKAFMFIIGAGIGSLITWKIVEQKYKKIADEEIESVIERFKNRDTLKTLFIDEYERSQEKEEIEKQSNEVDVEEYNDKINELGYSEEEPVKHVTKEIYVGDDDEKIEPYVIAPEEYGEVDSYDTKCLIYYSDLVLADEDDIIVSDREIIIGDALDHFGEYEDNSVFVRNENTECDYEILKHERPFSEVCGGIMNDTI